MSRCAYVFPPEAIQCVRSAAPGARYCCDRHEGLAQQPIQGPAAGSHRHLIGVHRHADNPMHPRAHRWHVHVWWKHSHLETATDPRTTVIEDDLVTFTVTICLPCLNGSGQECHTAGCALWMHEAPSEDVADALKMAALPGLVADELEEGR